MLATVQQSSIPPTAPSSIVASSNVVGIGGGISATNGAASGAAGGGVAIAANAGVGAVGGPIQPSARNCAVSTFFGGLMFVPPSFVIVETKML